MRARLIEAATAVCSRKVGVTIGWGKTKRAGMADTAFARAVEDVREGRRTHAEAAAQVVAAMRDDERLWLLDGDSSLYRGLAHMARAYNSRPLAAGAIPRLGLPGIQFTDGPRGVVVGRSTAFPAAICRAATWDPVLEERVGRAIGAEARAQGANFFAGVCVNLIRHPGWGRAQESYGEDPVLLGTMGTALACGARAHVMTCAKHFALNSIEDSRFEIDVRVDETALHEVYLPHFKALIETGSAALMTAYNKVNGEWCGDSRALITAVVRDEWGFDGPVVTDFVWGLREPVGSLAAGQDVELPFRQQRARVLPRALREGRLSIEDVDRSARRLVRTQLRHFAALGSAPDPSCIAGSEHRALAREVAVRGSVLLRNEPVDGTPVLPLRGEKVVLIGELADTPNLGDTGSSAVQPPSTCSVLEGLREALGTDAVCRDSGRNTAAAAAAASRAATAVVVVGLTAADEGEAFIPTDAATVKLLGPPFNRPRLALLLARGLRAVAPFVHPGGGDRRDLRLHAHDEQLIRAVAAANPRTVVVLIGGSAIIAESWRHHVPAILLAWYPGMEGGRAIGDVLFGHREPGGRLPLTIPTASDHLPAFHPAATRVAYDLWWGQRRLDRDGHRAAYPFGFGLGYTTFTITNLDVERRAGRMLAHVGVENSGSRDGSTVVQLYAVDQEEPRPIHRLLGFARVDAGAGESVATTITIDEQPISQRDRATRTWARRPGRWQLLAGQYAGDTAGISARLPAPP